MSDPFGGAEGAEAQARAELAGVRAGIEERLEPVRRVVAVTSGKGGVGKTAVAVQLAGALARRGLRVALLDADLQSPSVAAMLGLRGRPLAMRGTELRPVPGPAGLAVQGFDFFLQGGQALAWEGPEGEAAPLRSALEDAALADLLGQTAWGERDVLVVDLAPGADRLPALARLFEPELRQRKLAALAVTIPTEVALLSVERSVRRAQDARVPLLGLVENMGRVVCRSCGAESGLFREASVEERAEAWGLPVVARIPFDPALARAAEAGRLLDAEGGAAAAFDGLATHLARYAEGEEVPE